MNPLADISISLPEWLWSAVDSDLVRPSVSERMELVLDLAARDDDARAVGFDDGDKPDDRVANLEARGIEVIRDVVRARAVTRLRGYATVGGEIYNGDGQTNGGSQ